MTVRPPEKGVATHTSASNPDYPPTDERKVAKELKVDQVHKKMAATSAISQLLLKLMLMLVYAMLLFW